MWKIAKSTVRGAHFSVDCLCTEEGIRLDSLEFPAFWISINSETMEVQGRFDDGWFDGKLPPRPQCRLEISDNFYPGLLVFDEDGGAVEILLVPENRTLH
jgi:hypothetical protein